MDPLPVHLSPVELVHYDLRLRSIQLKELSLFCLSVAQRERAGLPPLEEHDRDKFNSVGVKPTLKDLKRRLKEAQNAAKTRNIYLSLESNVIGIFYLPLDSLPILASVISSRV